MIDGLVLAGGQSQRMGKDKALLQVSGQTLLQHLVTMMRPQTGHLFIAANIVPVPAMEGVTWLDDKLPGREGPLSGILAALEKSRASFLWIMPCDSFGVEPSLCERLLKLLDDTGAEIAYVTQNGNDHPLVALWRTSGKDGLRQFVDNGGRSVFRWYAVRSVVTLDLAPVLGQCLNLNTPEDYQALLGELE